MLKLPLSKKSFGLVELIVALAIVVVILTLSTVGINSLKDSFQLNSGTQELFNAISLARVYAENNVTYKDPETGQIKVPDAFMVKIGEVKDDVSNNVSIYYCNLDISEPSFKDNLSTEKIICGVYTNKVIEVDLSGVEIIKEQVGEMFGCFNIIFTVQGNELYTLFDNASEIRSSGGSECVVSVRGINSGSKTRILVNPLNRTIKKL